VELSSQSHNAILGPWSARAENGRLHGSVYFSSDNAILVGPRGRDRKVLAPPQSLLDLMGVTVKSSHRHMVRARKKCKAMDRDGS
jgi:hypothetical protein